MIVVVKGKMHFDGIEVAIYSPSIKNISGAPPKHQTIKMDGRFFLLKGGAE